MSAAPRRASMPRMVLRAVLFAGGLVLAVLLVHEAREAGLLDTGWIDTRVRDQGWQGRAIFLAVTAVATAFGLPRQALAFLGGYAFGAVEGGLLALAATLAGAAAAFGYARGVARAALAARFSHRLRRADRFLAENPFSAVLVIRLLPVGSNVVTNVLAGLSAVRLLPFMAASALGYLPQTAIFALLGKGVRVEADIQLALAALLFAGSTALAFWLYRRYRQAAAVAEAETADEDALAAAEPEPAGEGPPPR